MAEILIDIQANLNRLKSDLQQFFKQQFTVNTKANISGGEFGGSSGNGIIAGLKSQLADIGKKIDNAETVQELKILNKQQEEIKAKLQGAQSVGTSKGGKGGLVGFFSKMLIKLAPLAVLFKILDYFKVFDLIINYTMLGILKIWEWIKVFWPKLSPLWDKIKEWLSIAWGWIKTIWETIKPILKVMWDVVSAVWTKIIEWLKVGWSILVTVFKTIWTIITFVWNTLKEWGSKLWSGIKEAWNGIVEFFNTYIKPVIEKIWEIATGVWDSIKETVTNFFKDPIGTIKQGVEFLKTTLESLFNTFIKDLPQKLADAIKGFFSKDKSSSSRNYINPTLNPPSKDNRTTAQKIAGVPARSGTSIMNDGIITKGGKIIKLNPNDTLFASKNPNGMGGSTTINLYGVTQQETLNYIKRELGKQINMVGRY